MYRIQETYYKFKNNYEVLIYQCGPKNSAYITVQYMRKVKN